MLSKITNCRLLPRRSGGKSFPCCVNLVDVYGKRSFALKRPDLMVGRVLRVRLSEMRSVSIESSLEVHYIGVFPMPLSGQVLGCWGITHIWRGIPCMYLNLRCSTKVSPVCPGVRFLCQTYFPTRQKPQGSQYPPVPLEAGYPGGFNILYIRSAFNYDIPLYFAHWDRPWFSNSRSLNVVGCRLPSFTLPTTLQNGRGPRNQNVI